MLIGLIWGSILVLPVILAQDYPLPPAASSEACSFGLDISSSPLDCHPESDASEERCVSRGCCWHESSPGRPFCYFPDGFSSFEAVNVTHLRRRFRSQFPEDINLLRVDIAQGDHLAFRIVDAEKERWMTPYPKLEVDWSNGTGPSKPYHVQLNQGDKLMKVIREGKQSIAVEKATLMYSDQFIQLTFDLSESTLYGVGEHRTRLVLNQNWTKYSLWNHDGGPAENANLYGSQPFLLAVDSNGNATGIYLHNSNAIEIVLQPGPKVTFRSIGGILQFHYFFGPSPADVIRQYTQLVGLPPMPPYWALGFHLCRWGYGSANNTRAVWQKMRENNIPYDTQWNDIDYMKGNTDFTLDPDKFAELPQFIDELHDTGMHYVSMLDPGVSGSEPDGTYPPYSDGLDMDVFVKDINGEVFLGHVWNPNITVYPDFTHPRAYEYWSKQLRQFREKVKYDAIWIDMNEPSNFAEGSPNGCPESKLETPPYVPPVVGGVLQTWTMCLSNKHAISSHYDVHNIYAIAEADVTRRAVEDIIGKRTFLITRGNSPGIGHYSGHWSGDNNSAWSEMRASIIELLTYSLYGVPLMGADICGFGGEADRELCNRWQQLGAFYTFSRNHNTIGARDQDPTSFDEEVTNSVRVTLQMRYLLLPYLYTLFYQAQVDGSTVARPLFFEFPADSIAQQVDTAFLWGSSLYIVPVLEAGATSVDAYLPNARWFDFKYGNEITEKGTVTLPAPFHTIPVLIRGGSILPVQSFSNTTTESRKAAITFTVVPDENGNASGMLFWDDGESLDPVNNGAYGVVYLTLSEQKIQSKVAKWNTEPLTLGPIAVFGISSVSKVTFNGEPASYIILNTIMIITFPPSLVSDAFEITWSS